MNNLKFKAWHKKQKRMFDVYGFNEHYVFENTYDDCLATTHWIEDCELLQYSGFKDKTGKEIFKGHIIELVNEDGEKIRVVCEFGSAIRSINHVSVEIIGFYFQIIPDGKKTFPVVNNYLGEHDTEIFEIVGSIYETPDMVKVGE